MRIVVDAFGGDNAPDAILTGCARALAAFDDLSLLIAGDMNIIAQKSTHDLDIALSSSDSIALIDPPVLHHLPTEAMREAGHIERLFGCGGRR